MPDFYFQRIVVLESLPAEDYLRTGKDLCAYLRPMIADANFPPLVQFENFTSASELKEIIERLIVEVSYGKHVPLLHFETHGLKDGTGLSLADGSEIRWTELIPLFLKLNKATRFNLLIVLGACYAGDLWQNELRLDQPSFFFGIIAPSEQVRDYELLGAFIEMYRNLLTNPNAWDAFEKLVNRQLVEGAFQVQIAHESFLETLKKGHDFKFTPEKVEIMIKRNNEKSMKEFGYLGKHITVRPRKQQFKLYAAMYRKHVAESFHRFFMIDIFPENEARFGYIKTDLFNVVNEFWQSYK